ncbi:MAG: hypothetical protein A3I79_04760 [Gemmatimonadetes bacterium RIFCSPLOWO2_02_FULL_71_11]|nr:MAG: hypothetical protein A3I79_04760 [Gemmatimonadetes bacterium RIFCSPLOWO2_02_FULL_71_11]
MFYDPGCFGRVELGTLPVDVQRRLAALPGEWLEFDAPSGAIVVRYVQPTSSPSLPTIAGELVRIISEIPGACHPAIGGGDLYVHADQTLQLVRLRVEPGGAVHIRWAHPDYATARRRAWQRGTHDLVDPKVQRLNGRVSLTAAEPAKAARELQAVADTFEGLYPEGDCHAVADPAAGTVRVELEDVNLDAELLVAKLQQLATASSLDGRIDVGSFAGEAPEHYVRFVFENGNVWIQRPVLWDSEV